LKEAWVHLEKWSKEMVTTALENGADALVIPSGCHEKVKALGRITTVSEDGDMKPGKDVFFEPLLSPEDEARIARLLLQGPVVVEGTGGGSGKAEGGRRKAECRTRKDETEVGIGEREAATREETGGEGRTWEVIPLENLVARGGRLLVPVHSIEEMELALGVLERGVAGVVIRVRRPRELKALLARVKAGSEQSVLRVATIESIGPVGIGDRVCVDTCTLMKEGQGMLVGNSSGFLFLVQAEAKVNPYVAPRPFRVNAGPVHAYVRVPGQGTRYLSELKAGDPALIVGAQGATQTATIGRIKIERRPLLLVEAICENIRGSILLQNAETIRLTNPEGEARSVVELKPGDPILVAIEEAGRHFGMKVDETILEK